MYKIGSGGPSLASHHHGQTCRCRKRGRKCQTIVRKYRGSITLLKPAEYEEDEEPSPEWIAKLHKTYFGYLSDLQDLKVQTIIGTLPGTTKTAVNLKKVSQTKIKLILLATTKIQTNQNNLESDVEKEVNKFAGHADEIWSVGPDLFSYFDLIFEKSNVEHKQIIFKPDDEESYRSHNIPGTKRITSVWNQGHQLYFKGQQQKSNGSTKQSFEILGDAVALINEENKMRGKA